MPDGELPETPPEPEEVPPIMEYEGEPITDPPLDEAPTPNDPNAPQPGAPGEIVEG